MEKFKKLCAAAFIILLLVPLIYTRSSAQSPTKTVTMNVTNESLRNILDQIHRQTGLSYGFADNRKTAENERFSLKVQNLPAEEALAALFKDTKYTYEISGGLILVKTRPAPPVGEADRHVKGKVVDKNGQPLPGVTVMIEGTAFGTATDANGAFEFNVVRPGMTLLFTFVGMKSQKVEYQGQPEITVTLEEDATEIEEVVVTGAFTRKANTYSGAVTVLKGEELRRVGNQNVLQSLKNLDPSFLQIENLAAGSNPNALPDFQMRGSSTVANLQGEYASSANQPLFILDGFETDLTKILDLDMNMVESLTTLKDATAKAIYGSKAANGVIVIETRRPASGQMRVSYTGNLNIEAPDLSSYDLCDASEKLRVERMAGLFTSDNALTQISLDKTYTNKLKEILAGVDTDWKAQPTRVGIGHKHTLFLEGGDKSMLYGVELSYNNIKGVMKGSDRTTFSGGVTLSYRWKDLTFRNKLSIDYNDSNESPWGTFDEYCRMNPYSRLYDDNGNLVKSYSYTNAEGEVGEYYNPIYNTTLNTIDNETYTNINNNFYLEWQIRSNLRFTGRFGFVRKTTTEDVFKPANHTDFAAITDVFRKGSYSQSNGKHTNVNADAGLSYSFSVGKHLFFWNAQLNMSNNVYSTVGVEAEGFPNDYMNDISFAIAYAKDKKPTGTEGISRSCGGLLSLNYSYDERYLFDANYRLSGSSETGSDNRWGSFWSGGGGWNVHNESFMKGQELINRLKLRASFGYTGSQGFSSYDAMATFVYFTNTSYNGSIGSYVKGLANPALRWQEKYDSNFGADIDLFGNRLTARFDYYISRTKGMITNVTVPGSTGFSTFVDNLGETENKGYELYLNYKVFERSRDYINVNASMSHNKNTLKKISNSLRAWNDSQDKTMIEEKSTTPSVKYFEGCSMNAIWAVPSLGIDPQNGKEIFVRRDGTVTYDYDVTDQVVCGDNQPKFNGNIGVNGEIKGFGFSVTANYRWGGQLYNSTLVSKVENAPIEYNVDRRVFTDRWQKAGDRALYKSITDQSTTYPTSRFVEDYNTFTLSSLSLYYDFRDWRFVKNSFLDRLKVTAYTSDLFVISSVKTERGTSYPFARTFSLSVQATF